MMLLTTNITADPSTPNLTLVTCNLIEFKFPLYGWQKIYFKIIPGILGVIWIPTVVLNIVALIVYLKKVMRKRLANLFILNTIIADLLTGVLSIPVAICFYTTVVYAERAECLLTILMIPSFIFFSVSFLMVTFAAVDRYLAVFRPYFYSIRLAHWTTLYHTLVLFLWIFSVLVIMLIALLNIYNLALFFILIQLVINFYINVKILLAVRNVRNTIRSQCISATRPPRDGESVSDVNKGNNDNSSTIISSNPLTGQVDKENAKSNRTVTLVLISLCLCYLPYVGTHLFRKNKNAPSELHTVDTMAYLLCFFKSVLNPIIYWYTLPSVRKMMRTYLLCRRKKSYRNVVLEKNTLL